MQLDILSASGVVVAGSGVLVAVLTYVSQQGRNLRDSIKAGDDAVAKDEANHRLTLTAVLQQHHTDIEVVKRDYARKDEVRAVEARMEAMATRFDGKLDRILEKLQEVAVLAVRNDAKRDHTE